MKITTENLIDNLEKLGNMVYFECLFYKRQTLEREIIKAETIDKAKIIFKKKHRKVNLLECKVME